MTKTPSSPAPRLRIATDIDGVLADFRSGWVERYDDRFGTALDLRTLTTWDSIVTSTRFATNEEFFGWLSGVPGFWAGLLPIPGATAAVDELRRGGHQVSIASQRPRRAEAETRFWLETHFGALDFELVNDKADVDCDLFIDDSPIALRRLSQLGRTVVRFSQPWNAGAPGLAANNWEDVLQIVDEMEDARRSTPESVLALRTQVG